MLFVLVWFGCVFLIWLIVCSLFVRFWRMLDSVVFGWFSGLWVWFDVALFI